MWFGLVEGDGGGWEEGGETKRNRTQIGREAVTLSPTIPTRLSFSIASAEIEEKVSGSGFHDVSLISAQRAEKTRGSDELSVTRTPPSRSPSRCFHHSQRRYLASLLHERILLKANLDFPPRRTLRDSAASRGRNRNRSTRRVFLSPIPLTLLLPSRFLFSLKTGDI